MHLLTSALLIATTIFTIPVTNNSDCTHLNLILLSAKKKTDF